MVTPRSVSADGFLGAVAGLPRGGQKTARRAHADESVLIALAAAGRTSPRRGLRFHSGDQKEVLSQLLEPRPLGPTRLEPCLIEQAVLVFGPDQDQVRLSFAALLGRMSRWGARSLGFPWVGSTRRQSGPTLRLTAAWLESRSPRSRTGRLRR